MWLLADLFHELPEVGDADKPKLVFFFDEAHLLFADASKEFLAAIAQTVRLIRSKGVGIFFVTQTPKDVPDDVLAQLGSRVQHQLRAHTPNDAKALKPTVSTFPQVALRPEEVLTQLGIGEAIVTVMDPDGAPTPVAWTRMRAPLSLMAPTPEEVLRPGIAASGLMAKYGADIDRDSAHEMLARKLQAGAERPSASGRRRRPRRRPSSGPRPRLSFARSASAPNGRRPRVRGRPGAKTSRCWSRSPVQRVQRLRPHCWPGDRPQHLRHRPPAPEVSHAAWETRAVRRLQPVLSVRSPRSVGNLRGKRGQGLRPRSARLEMAMPPGLR